MVRPAANGKLVKQVLANTKGVRSGSKKMLPKKGDATPENMTQSRKKRLKKVVNG